MLWIGRWATAVALLVAGGGAMADVIPGDIRVIVPVVAGSSLDARARMIAEALSQRLKRPVVVENRTGAGGTIGTLAVAKAKPDGSVLLFTNNSHVISPHVYPGTGYDPIKDFAPVAQAYVSGVILVTHPGLKVGTLQELVELSRTSREPLTYGSSGAGSLPHLAFEMLNEVTGMRPMHIPYRGDAQAMADVLAGRVSAMMSGYVVALPLVKAGKLRALAVSQPRRTPIFPDVPTIAEAGFPAYALEVWTGFLAPAGTPAATVAALNEQIALAIASPQIRAQFAATGAQAAVGPPADFGLFLRQELGRYAKIVQGLGLKPE
ncbi:MAG TPA: tripartite tricarboxylate transporter substrate binding protein [Burkholderiales bacterium]|nr:tripartite tricarboxylate transporter substrate binding protein [Burkholderiales bacterium]